MLKKTLREIWSEPQRALGRPTNSERTASGGGRSAPTQLRVGRVGEGGEEESSEEEGGEGRDGEEKRM